MQKFPTVGFLLCFILAASFIWFAPYPKINAGKQTKNYQNECESYFSSAFLPLLYATEHSIRLCFDPLFMIISLLARFFFCVHNRTECYNYSFLPLCRTISVEIGIYIGTECDLQIVYTIIKAARFAIKWFMPLIMHTNYIHLLFPVYVQCSAVWAMDYLYAVIISNDVLR